MPRCRWPAGLVLVTTLVGPQPSARAEDRVEVKVAKYADLAATIKKLKGKVVVVDFWADW